MNLKVIISIIFGALLIGCTENDVRPSNIRQDNKDQSPEMVRTLINSEAKRRALRSSPNYLSAKVIAQTYYGNPEAVYTIGTALGYISVCPGVSTSIHSEIVANQIEFLELSSIDFTSFEGGVPNLKLISAKKKLLLSTISEHRKEGQLVADYIKSEYCGEILSDLRRSVWEIAS